MKKEAILITSNFSSDTGFAWKYFFKIFNYISSGLHEKQVGICLSFAKVVEPVTILNADIPFEVFAFDPLHIDLNGVLKLRKNIKKNNIKYGYFTDFPTWHWLYPFMRIWGIKKIIVHNHVSAASPYLPSDERGIKRFLKIYLNNSKFFSVDAVYVCSNFVKNILLRKACCPEEKIEVILHGIDIEKFSCPEVAKHKEEHIITILCVARATRFKGIHVLIEAVRLLREEHRQSGFRVRYVGDGPDMKEFKDLVSRYHLHDCFFFIGALPETQEEICQADIVVAPSCWGDALPLSVIEAMAGKKPVIATEVGGIPEEIGIDSECGILIPPNNEKVLALELAKLIENSERQKILGENARKRAEMLFAEDRFHSNVLFNLLRDTGINSDASFKES